MQPLQLLDFWADTMIDIFPEGADINVRDGNDYIIRVSWPLKNDKSRPNKKSKTIKIIFPHEVLEDYLEERHNHKIVPNIKLLAFLENKLKEFDPNHSSSPRVSPPVVEWIIPLNYLL